MNFSQIYGHDKIKNLLQSAAASGTPSHAYIFNGKSGVGRLSTALAFACALVYGGDGASRSPRPTAHPDIRIITNELYDPAKAEGKALSVDTIRAMRKEIYIKPYSAERKVYIVPEADTMTAAAQNSLLKVLEEPPNYCVIILISENFNIFLPTVLSRAVLVKFRPLPPEVIAQYLKDTAAPNVAAHEAVARMCGGSIKTALELLEDEGIVALRDNILKLLLNLASRKITAAYDLIIYLKRNKKTGDSLLETAEGFLRDLLVIKNYGTAEGVTNRDILGELQNFAAGITTAAPARMLEAHARYNKMIQANGNYAACAECMVLEIWDCM